MILRLNSDLYNEKYIKQSILAFKEFIDIELNKEKTYFIVEFKEKADNIKTDVIIGDFCNYCLGLMATQKEKIKTDLEVDVGFLNTVKIQNLNKDLFYVFPHKIKKINKLFLITTDFGSWIFLDKKTLKKLNENCISDDLKYKLEKNNIILTQNNYENIIKKYFNKYIFLHKKPSLYIIELTNICNQTCVYCHAKPGDKEHFCEKKLSKDVADKILNSIFEHSPADFSIELQGGEPLLNFSVVEHILKRVDEKNKEMKKNCSVTLVSNLTLLNKKILKKLIQYKCRICTSLDGPKKLHDKNRPLKEKSGFDKTISSINNLKNTYDLNVGALITITKFSIPYFKEIIDSYVKQDITNIHLRKVHRIGEATNNKDNIDLGVDEFNTFWKKCFDYILELNKKGIPIKERFVVIILKKLFNIPVLYTDLQSPCGLISGQIAYSSDGNMYCCDIARNREFFHVGDSKKDKLSDVFEKSSASALIKASINDFPSCIDCIFEPFCGICPVMNYFETGSLLSNPKLTEKCKINYFIFNTIFSALQDPKKRKTLLSWI